MVLIGMMVSYRRERHRKTAQLLTNMEGPLRTAPYQEEPIQTEYSDDPNNSATTVIRNDIYRDSLLLEPDGTSNGVIVAYTDPTNQDGRQSIYNPRSSRRTRNVGRCPDGVREEEVILRVQDISRHPNYPNENDRY